MLVTSVLSSCLFFSFIQFFFSLKLCFSFSFLSFNVYQKCDSYSIFQCFFTFCFWFVGFNNLKAIIFLFLMQASISFFLTDQLSHNSYLLIMVHFLSLSSTASCSSSLSSDLDSSELGMSSSPSLHEGGILSPSPDPLPPPLPNPVNLCLPEHGQEEEFIPVSDHQLDFFFFENWISNIDLTHDFSAMIKTRMFVSFQEVELRVSLVKSDKGSLGFTLTKGPDDNCYIHDIIQDPAKGDGRLYPGDRMIMV